ncbi:MAG: PqqD family protein [Thermoanaerobaculia bacterium]
MNPELKIPERVDYTVIEGKAILLDTDAGISLELDEVATRMWELLDELEDPEAAVASLLQEYDVEEDRLRTDFQSFLEQLSDKGFLEPASGEDGDAGEGGS